MKKKWIMLMCCLTVFTMCFTGISVTASGLNNEKTTSFVEAVTNATRLLDTYEEKFCIETVQMLYDENETTNAVLIHLSPKGYIISKTTGDIVEYSVEHDFKGSTEQRLYYAGPMQYYVKANTEYKHTISGSSVTVKEFSESSRYFKKITPSVSAEQNGSQPVSEIQGTYNGSLTGSLRTYSYNPNGICGSTAAAIFLMYYDDYINSSMVTSTYTTSDGEKLIKYLVPHIDGSEPGSNTSDMVAGLNWYIRDRGLSSTYSAISQEPATYTTYCARIRANRPVIIDLDEHPTYNEHWVVGYGFTNRQTTKYAEVGDGWGNNAVMINWNYVGDIVYLNA